MARIVNNVLYVLYPALVFTGALLVWESLMRPALREGGRFRYSHKSN
jgi:hypothetical protein